MTLVAQDNPRMMILLDASKGMQGKIGKNSKLTIAKKSLNHILGKSTYKIDVGLTLFGHRSKNDCDDIERVIDISLLDKKKFRTTLKSVKAQGKVPILLLLKTVAKEMKYKEQKTTIILISSSQDTCHPDPCAMVKTLTKKAKDLKIHVLGMKVKKRAKKQLSCIADVTGGRYFTIKNQQGLDSSLEMLIKEIAYIKPKPKRVYIPDVMPVLKPIPLLEKKENNVEINALIAGKKRIIKAHHTIYMMDEVQEDKLESCWSQKGKPCRKELPSGHYLLESSYNTFVKKRVFEVLVGEGVKLDIAFNQIENVQITASEVKGAKKIDIHGYIYAIDKEGIVNRGKVWALNQHHKNNINNYKLPLGKYIMTVEYNAFTKDIPFEIKANKKNKVHVIMGQTGKIEISVFDVSTAKPLSIDGYIYPIHKKGKIANMYIKKIHHDTKRIFSVHRLPVGKYMLKVEHKGFKKEILFIVKANKSRKLDIGFKNFLIKAKCRKRESQVSYEIFNKKGKLVHEDIVPCSKALKIFLDKGRYHIAVKIDTFKKVEYFTVNKNTNKFIVNLRDLKAEETKVE